MEKKLKELFDYQRFEKNGHLARLIAETEDRYARELSDDDLASVSAAGDAAVPLNSRKGRKRKEKR